jgi:hypothetical protein
MEFSFSSLFMFSRAILGKLELLGKLFSSGHMSRMPFLPLDHNQCIWVTRKPKAEPDNRERNPRKIPKISVAAVLSMYV